MRFFEAQAQARQQTSRLVVLFCLAVVSIVAIVTLIAHLVLFPKRAQRAMQQMLVGQQPREESALPEVAVACATMLVIIGGTLWRMHQLGGNGTSVALLMGAVPVADSTVDDLERRYRNVVEEIAIASGVPVPRIFVMSNEQGINAFAAGLTPRDAVVAVTRGTLEKLDRDELQGVIAHEFSHIFNGDMRLNFRLIGVLAGIFAISTIGRAFMRARGRNSGGLVVAGVGLFAVGYTGVFFGRLIKAAISRQREFLADASAVQYTRNPLGIGGALVKIHYGRSFVSSTYAEEASHMFFGSALDFWSLFATHPPLPERIRRVHPTLLETMPPPEIDAERALAETATRELMASAMAQPLPTVVNHTASAKEIVDRIGAPRVSDLVAAREVIGLFGEEIHAACRDQMGSRELIAALLLESDSGSERQRAIISDAWGDAAVERVIGLRLRMAPVLRHRLSALILALPAIRSLPPVQQRAFLVLLREMALADRHFELFEYVALTIVESQLDRSARRRPRVGGAAPVAVDLSLLLSALAYAGCDDPALAKAAFDSGATEARQAIRAPFEFLHVSDCKFETVSMAVRRLAVTSPWLKNAAINACVATILHDRKITQRESELLHAICSALDVPLPKLATMASA